MIPFTGIEKYVIVTFEDSLSISTYIVVRGITQCRVLLVVRFHPSVPSRRGSGPFGRLVVDYKSPVVAPCLVGPSENYLSKTLLVKIHVRSFTVKDRRGPGKLLLVNIIFIKPLVFFLSRSVSTQTLFVGLG